LEIVHDAIIGDSEDGGARVFIDGDDRVRTLHGSDVLKGAADADGKIDFRLYGFSGDSLMKRMKDLAFKFIRL